jgi:DNA-binding CsgD family transcriptional regulator
VRQQSLAATVEWSYRLLDEPQQRVFRALSVFPGGFTLEGAQAVAGADAGPTVLDLVDCSLLAPPRPGPDGRSRYWMLETLRAYATQLLARAGDQEQAAAAAALAGYALAVAEQAAAGLYTSEAELPAARWLDAEDATMRQVLAWAVDHDLAGALRLVAALGWWWVLRGRLGGVYPLLRGAADRAEPGSDGWCTAQYWLGWSRTFSYELAGALDHFTAVCDAAASRPPARALADALAMRSLTLESMGRIAEAAGDGRRALSMARQIGYPAGELMALAVLCYAASDTGDHDEAVRLARQAAAITAGVPGPLARACDQALTFVLIAAGDLAAAERVSAAGLFRAREAGDLLNQSYLLPLMAELDLRAGRTADARAHLREGLQIAERTGSWGGLLNCLYSCGSLCAATGRPAGALTVWAASAGVDARERHDDYSDAFMSRWEEQRDEARQALEPGQARAAEERGAAMSLATAAEYALMLTAAEPQPPAAGPGLGKLSERERELVTLVAQGRTDAQIAAQLYISVRTVSSHLDRIRDKTGCRRRADLTRLALSAGLV